VWRNKYMQKAHRRFQYLIQEIHKIQRMKFVTDEVYSFRHQPKFHDFSNTVHLDEKWFFGEKVDGYYYWPTDEALPPPDRIANKQSIQKIMFLVVLAMPVLNKGFDGLIGIYPFVKESVFVRGPRRGEQKLVHEVSVNGEVYKQYLLEKVIPDVKRKMPWMRGKEMYIQHDGAKAHLPAEHDAAIDQALTANRWKINLVRQPARSPFLNMCDLCLLIILCSVKRKKLDSEAPTWWSCATWWLVNFGGMTLRCCCASGALWRTSIVL